MRVSDASGSSVHLRRRRVRGSEVRRRGRRHVSQAHWRRTMAHLPPPLRRRGWLRHVHLHVVHRRVPTRGESGVGAGRGESGDRGRPVAAGARQRTAGHAAARSSRCRRAGCRAARPAGPEARRPSCWTTHAPAAYAPGHCRRPAATKLRCALARSRTPCERAARGDRTLSRAEGSAAGWGQGEGWGVRSGRAAPRRVAIAGRGGRAANLETTASLRSPERGSGAEIRLHATSARVCAGEEEEEGGRVV